MTVTEDPFLTLVVEALNLMHPRFASAHGREYAPSRFTPATASDSRQNSTVAKQPT